jgi:hypothetical protein
VLKVLVSLKKQYQVNDNTSLYPDASLLILE